MADYTDSLYVLILALQVYIDIQTSQTTVACVSENTAVQIFN